MAEIRRDVVSGRWVIIASERASRPRDFTMGRGGPRGGFCPFCEGNEDRTPPEVAAIRVPGTAPDTPGWKVRVVPNKFPALDGTGELNATGAGLYHKVDGIGAHEVIIESPRHAISPTEMSVGEFEDVVRMYCERSAVLARDERLAYVLIFKNVGEAAGASIEHGHSQLIAVPVMPRRVHEEMQHCEVYYSRRRQCLFCDIIRQELSDGDRVVMENDSCVVLSPYAARFPYEMWVVPKKHACLFHAGEPAVIADTARILHETIVRLEICLGDPPFNYAVHTAPVTGYEPAYYHWHIELIPRVTRVAGFEWGTGFYINPVAPESAAEFMRKVGEQQVKDKIGTASAV